MRCSGRAGSCDHRAVAVICFSHKSTLPDPRERPAEILLALYSLVVILHILNRGVGEVQNGSHIAHYLNLNSLTV